eukprot:jgi/Chrzof1/8114/UNPLg00159.t1
MADQDEKERLAREMYGRSYEELDTNEKRSVAGKIGGEHRKQQMAQEAGDVHQAYSELGKEGGRARGGGGAD